MESQELARFNPWWTTGKVREALLERFKRKAYYSAERELDRRQATLIWGMRRMGKTVLTYQLIDKLLREGTSPRNILYFSFDEVSSTIDTVLEAYQREVLNKTFESSTRRIYVFFDEVQKADDWENKVKLHYDLYPNVKFVLTGSASVPLRRGSRESMAGRMFSLLVEPLSFEEFLEISGMDVEAIRGDPRLWDRTLAPLFHRYLKYGSFPELVSEEDEERARNYIREGIVERVIYRDLPSEFGLRDVELLKALFYIVAANPGAIMNYRKISKDLGRDQRTVADYFEYLEYGLLTRFVYNYRGSPVASSRKAKKVYLGTPSLALAADRARNAKLLENFVLMKTGAKFFYRNGFEVDFVLPEGEGFTAIEVKERGVTRSNSWPSTGSSSGGSSGSCSSPWSGERPKEPRRSQPGSSRCSDASLSRCLD
ncbi:MAG: ATP-binding protein [Nitrososphaerota archaeon]|nr:ATP-binding protein [Nitrososphaerota archaeon]